MPTLNDLVAKNLPLLLSDVPGGMKYEAKSATVIKDKIIVSFFYELEHGKIVYCGQRDGLKSVPKAHERFSEGYIGQGALVLTIDPQKDKQMGKIIGYEIAENANEVVKRVLDLSMQAYNAKLR